MRILYPEDEGSRFLCSVDNNVWNYIVVAFYVDLNYVSLK
jgi:hypothetical protein